MKFEHTQVFNFEGALRGMRNPLESWSKSDSSVQYGRPDSEWTVQQYQQDGIGFVIGPNDMNLAQRLIKGGSEHRKFLRQIFVSVDITAPLYFWKELDTYQVGTTKNSTSTMHRIMSKPFTLDLFETDDLYGDEVDDFNYVLSVLNRRRELYLRAKEEHYNKALKRHWKAIIRLLPESWLQTRTITMNYEILRNIVHQRKGHKLTEWHQFIDWAHTLPYADEFIFYDGQDKRCANIAAEDRKKILEESDSIFEAVDKCREVENGVTG